MSLKNHYSYLVILCWLSGCGTVNFEDVSKEYPYETLIGKRYETQSKLLIHGINRAHPNGQDIDYYMVTVEPGFSDWSVNYYGFIPIGSTIEIIDVRSCVNCFLDFGARIELGIRINPRDGYDQKQTLLSNGFGGSDIFEFEGAEIKVNSNILRELKNGT